jgi:predicted enzyme related to lactoylglutathione lyase
MIATTLKKYVLVIKFYNLVFGKKFTGEEKMNFNEQNFGKIIYFLTDSKGNKIESDVLIDPF